MSLVEHFIAFRNDFNKFNKSGARLLGSIYYMTSTFGGPGLQNYLLHYIRLQKVSTGAGCL